MRLLPLILLPLVLVALGGEPAWAASGQLSQLTGKDGCISATGSGGCARARGVRSARAIEVSRDGKSVYVASPLDSAVAVFTRGKGGALRQPSGANGCIGPEGKCVPLRGPEFANDVAVSRDGRNVYVAGDGIATYSRNASTGRLTQLPGAAGCVGVGACTRGRAVRSTGKLAISDDGRNVYLASFDGVAVFSRGPTGALSQLPGEAGCVSDNPSIPAPGPEGCAAARGLGADESGPVFVAVSADGRAVYVASPLEEDASKSAIAIFARDTETGALSQAAGEGACVSDRAGNGEGGCTRATGIDSPSDIAISRDGRSVYVGSQASQDEGGLVGLFRRTPPGGALTQLSGRGGCLDFNALTDANCAKARGLRDASAVAVTPDGRNVYVTDAFLSDGGIATFARNTSSGALTQLSGRAGCIRSRRTADCAAGRALGGAGTLAVSSDGRNVYVGAPFRSGLAVFKR